DQEVEDEARRSLHQRPGPLREELPVAAIEVVLPGMAGEPGRAHRPDTPDSIGRRRAAEEVAQVVDHPAARAVMYLGGALARGDQRFQPVEERQVALGEVCR